MTKLTSLLTTRSRRALLMGAAAIVPLQAAGATSPEADGDRDRLASVTVLTGNALSDSYINDLRDLAIITPGLTVTGTSSGAFVTPRVRGIGTAGENAGLEPSVGLFIDGVPRPRAAAGFGDFVGVERIEVLRGPQGTLFGASTPAGAINVITRRPTHDDKITAEATAGDFGALGAAVSFNAGLSEMVAARLDFATRRRDGFLDIVTGAGPRTDTEDTDQNAYALRGQLLYTPNANFDVNLSIDFSNRDENCCAAVTLLRGVTAPFLDMVTPAPGDTGIAPVADPFARRAWSNRSTQSTLDDLGGDIRMAWKGDWLGGAKLTSITSLRQWKSIAGADLDYSTADLFYREPTESDGLLRTETFTQQFRLEGSTSRFDWQVGVAYLQEDLDRNEAYRIGAGYEPFLSLAILQRINPALATSPTAPLFLSQASGRPYGSVFPALSASDQYRQETSRTSFFTDNTWHATKDLDLSFGLRLTLEDKELTSSYANPTGASGCSAMLASPAQVVAALVARGLTVAQASAAAPQVVGFACQPWTNSRHNGRLTAQSIDDTEWSGTLKAAYRFDEHVLAYISASRDYKPAGFNMDRVQSSTGLPGGANGTIPVDDTSFGAEAVESYELGVQSSWMDGALRFDATLFHQQFSDYQFSDFNGVSTRVLSIPDVTSTGVDANLVWSRDGLFVQAGLTYAETTYGDDVLPDATLGLLPGNQLGFAPKWTVNGAVGYEWSVNDHLKLRADIGARFVSDHNTGYDLDPAKAQDAYTLVNARLALAQSEDAWSIELWGRNLTDEDYLEQSFDTPLQIGTINAFLGAPRTLGVTLRLDY